MGNSKSNMFFDKGGDSTSGIHIDSELSKLNWSHADKIKFLRKIRTKEEMSKKELVEYRKIAKSFIKAQFK